MGKEIRIRDPLHNLIIFSAEDTVDRYLWELVQTRAFQRLRRIKQLGFTDCVFPGATHTRFSHSLGVFHMAKRMLNEINNIISNEYKNISEAHKAKTAALFHDIGHCMFSHAFETAVKDKNKFSHERMTRKILLEDEEFQSITEKYFSEKDILTGAARIISTLPSHPYHAIVSSQFDADRIDYMQRDILMTGIQDGGIDVEWILSNIDVKNYRNEDDSNVIYFAMKEKAIPAVELYAVSLFQLYKKAYLHKTTRAAEVVFKEIIKRLHNDAEVVKSYNINMYNFFATLNDSGDGDDFYRNVMLEDYYSLDDINFYGLMFYLVGNAEVRSDLKTLSYRLLNRKLPKCIDVYNLIENYLRDEDRTYSEERVNNIINAIKKFVDEYNRTKVSFDDKIFIDEAERGFYKKISGKNGVLDRINVVSNSGYIYDISKYSDLVNSAIKYKVFRIYFFNSNKEDTVRRIKDIINYTLVKE